MDLDNMRKITNRTKDIKISQTAMGWEYFRPKAVNRS
jgi:hypothetical protein